MTAATDRVRDILAGAVVDGTRVRIPNQLDRADYLAVNKALEAVGGKWSRKERAHVFDNDPSTALTAIIRGGAVPASARTAEGYVRTPAALAARIVVEHLLDLHPAARILEPSAGDGALVRALAARHTHTLRVTAVEPNADRAARIDGATVHVETLETFAAARLPDGDRYDVAFMNPPFAVPDNRTIWVDHVNLVWQLLAPGGRLVAIVPASYAFRRDRRHTALRELIEEHGSHQPLPADAFRETGTDIRTVLLVARKPVAAGADVLR